MALTALTNTIAGNMQRSLAISTADVSRNTASLSSGRAVNSAKDDPSNLQISERYSSQINCMERGNDNADEGIAVLQLAEGALDETVAYVKERKQFGRSIAAFQNTQFELAEMKARVDAAKYLVYAAAQKKQAAMDGAKVRYSVEAAEAKLIASRTASDVTRRCLQLFGGYGYTRDYPIERMMRDAKITEIYEGTSEVMMMVISGALLK